MDHISEILDLLELDSCGHDTFIGKHPVTLQQRTFGGQVMAQALAAMYRTVPSERLCHSLKGYFLRAGVTSEDITYTVARPRDGGSFTTRGVTASQGGHEIFTMSASFKEPEDGLEHAALPSKPPTPPESCVPLTEQLRTVAPQFAAMWEREWAAIDTRFVGFSNRETSEGARMQVWLRSVGDVPDDPRIHQMVLAYASDLTLLVVSALAHPQTFGSPDLQIATIDHSMWFHRPIRVDDWVLYDQSSPNAANALGLSFGSLYDEHGALGAHAVQEGLIRLGDERRRRGLV
ncbi:MAG: acyl-CoA thioesterase II [Propioniciclava sp.]|uniref:acyl-CoA thioesterase n=1 Tax=Propioniciclava sp. TaxID=2038686 RepID=UPI0039E6CEAE